MTLTEIIKLEQEQKNNSYKTVGNKYDRSLSTKEIAVLIRNDIKQLGYTSKQGFKISVTSDYNSINIYVREMPGDNYITPEYLEAEKTMKEDWNKWLYTNTWERKYTKEYKDIYNNLKQIHSSYNFDNSEAMTDYFHVNYYGSVSMPYKY